MSEDAFGFIEDRLDGRAEASIFESLYDDFDRVARIYDRIRFSYCVSQSCQRSS